MCGSLIPCLSAPSDHMMTFDPWQLSQWGQVSCINLARGRELVSSGVIMTTIIKAFIFLQKYVHRTLLTWMWKEYKWKERESLGTRLACGWC